MHRNKPLQVKRPVTSPNVRRVIPNKEHGDETTGSNTSSRKLAALEISVITSTLGGKSLVSREKRKYEGKGIFSQFGCYIGCQNFFAHRVV